MTIERLLVDAPSGALLAGLAWRPPSGGKPSRAALREARSLTDASAYVVARAGSGAVQGPGATTPSVYGLFQARPSEEDQRLPKAVLSAAAVFALHVGAHAPHAVLLLRMAGQDLQAPRFYVVVLDDGLPAIDALMTEPDLQRALGEEDRPMWSDDPVRYPGAFPASLDWLVQLAREPASKVCLVAGFPLNPWPAVIAAVALALCAGAWVGWEQVQDANARAAARAAAAAEDPVPRYLGALSASRRGALANRAQWLQVTQSLFELPAFVPGWQLRSVECRAQTHVCAATWARRGGRFEELRAAFPKYELVIGGVGGVGGVGSAGGAGADGGALVAPNFDLATMRWACAVARQPLPAPLLSYAAAVLAGGNLFQRWKTAELAVDFKPPTLWPVAAGVPPTLRVANAVGRGEVVASDVAAPFVAEALRSAPPWLSWEAVHLEVADPATGSGRGQLKFTLSGTYYVSIAN